MAATLHKSSPPSHDNAPNDDYFTNNKRSHVRLPERHLLQNENKRIKFEIVNGVIRRFEESNYCSDMSMKASKCERIAFEGPELPANYNFKSYQMFFEITIDQEGIPFKVEIQYHQLKSMIETTKHELEQAMARPLESKKASVQSRKEFLPLLEAVEEHQSQLLSCNSEMPVIDAAKKACNNSQNQVFLKHFENLNFKNIFVSSLSAPSTFLMQT